MTGCPQAGRLDLARSAAVRGVGHTCRTEPHNHTHSQQGAQHGAVACSTALALIRGVQRAAVAWQASPDTLWWHFGHSTQRAHGRPAPACRWWAGCMPPCMPRAHPVTGAARSPRCPAPPLDSEHGAVCSLVDACLPQLPLPLDQQALGQGDRLAACRWVGGLLLLLVVVGGGLGGGRARKACESRASFDGRVGWQQPRAAVFARPMLASMAARPAVAKHRAIGPSQPAARFLKRATAPSAQLCLG